MKNENVQLIYNPEHVVLGLTNAPSNVSIFQDPEIDVIDYSKLAALEYKKISNINTLEEYLDYKLDLLKTKDINMILFELTRIERLVDSNKVFIDFLKDKGARCNEDLYYILDQYKDKLIELLQQKYTN